MMSSEKKSAGPTCLAASIRVRWRSGSRFPGRSRREPREAARAGPRHAAQGRPLRSAWSPREVAAVRPGHATGAPCRCSSTPSPSTGRPAARRRSSDTHPRSRAAPRRRRRRKPPGEPRRRDGGGATSSRWKYTHKEEALGAVAPGARPGHPGGARFQMTLAAARPLAAARRVHARRAAETVCTRVAVSDRAAATRAKAGEPVAPGGADPGRGCARRRQRWGRGERRHRGLGSQAQGAEERGWRL
jgi:hypothetical protein